MSRTMSFAAALPGCALALGLLAAPVPSAAQLQGGLLAGLAIAAYAFYVKKAKEWSDKNM